MNNSSNRPFALKTPPTEDFMRVVRDLHKIATRLGIPFFLAGAAARDLVLVNLWGQSPGRATVDIDFAFAVNTWAEFGQLREDLLVTGRFERVPRKEQRLLYTGPEHRFHLPVDFIPFGGVASETLTISWPPEGDFVMNVAGFEEALAASLCIELEPGLAISVASLPGLAILKVVAWADRHLQNNRDAPDIFNILTGFERAGNQDRIYDEDLEFAETVAFDLTLAGAHLLGRDAARIADSAASRQIVNLLNSETQVNLLISHMITTASYEENAALVARIFDCFRHGYLETASINAGS
jgi:predicted nucleotidyltransferase